MHDLSVNSRCVRVKNNFENKFDGLSGSVKHTLREKCPNTGTYGPEKTPYLDNFHAMQLQYAFNS